MFIEFSEKRKEKIQLKVYLEPEMEIEYLRWDDIIITSNINVTDPEPEPGVGIETDPRDPSPIPGT